LLGLLLIILLAAVWVLLPEVAYRAVVGAERTYSGVYRAELDQDGRAIAYLEGGQGPDLMLLHPVFMSLRQIFPDLVKVIWPTEPITRFLHRSSGCMRSPPRWD
jgi:hypothetical protein